MIVNFVKMTKTCQKCSLYWIFIFEEDWTCVLHFLSKLFEGGKESEKHIEEIF